MFAVHGLWSAGRGLLLWAEDGDRPTRSPSNASRSARQHPFAVPAEQLAAIHPGKPGLATLLLPSRRQGPLDSPELIRVTPRSKSRTAPELQAWLVPVVAVDPAELADPVEQVRYGASVGYLRALVDFAADLAARGRVLPSIHPGEPANPVTASPGTTPRAMWRPVISGPDVVVLHSLVAAMPPVVRAEQSGPQGMAVLTGSAGQDPTALVEDALAALVDAEVRDRLARGSSSAIDLPRRRGRAPRRTPVAETWLEALTSGDGGFDAEPAEVATLGRAVAPWDGVGAEEAGPARATFRLAETKPLDDPWDPDPTMPDTAWRLEFLLRSTQDPSLLVPAEQVWASPDGLSRWIDRPQEVLLAELAGASAVYPELTEALRGAAPSALELDVEGAYRFLSEAAARLDQTGFGVMLPAWWSAPKRRLGLSVSASSSSADSVVTEGGLSKDKLARFEWRLAVGDDVLSEQEITELVAAKAPLVRLRGQWVAVDADRLRRGLEFLRAAPVEASTPSELLAIVTGQDVQETPLPITAVSVHGWLGELLSGASEKTLTPVEPSPDFLATLRPYQQRGLSWLTFLSSLGLGACLADDMGLGKTIQLLALESRERAVLGPPTQGAENPDSRGLGPSLLLCPMSLVGNWQREAGKFAPTLRVYAHHGAGRDHGPELAARLAEADLVVTTYSTLTRDIEELAEPEWHRVVLDEAQLVKNSRSNAAKAVRLLRAGHRIALTGTPMENRLSELWSVMDFLNPGVLGTSERFRQRYAIPVERNGDAEVAQKLRRVTRPYLLRRVKTDKEIIDDLPEKIEIIQDYRLTPEQASLYRTVVDDMMEKIEGSDGIARRGSVLAAMAKLKQVCNHPAQLLHDGSPLGQRSGKVTRLEEVLAEILAEGDKAICFTQFTEFAEMLVPHLSARFDQEVLYLHGGTSRAKRDEMVQRFQSSSGPAIFLLSLKAGGTGLTLTAANHVLHLDRWWNPAVENQATDRAFRIGQKRNVQVRKFVCAGTLEERIDAMIEAKKELANLVISDGEGWLTELSTGELRELFALSDEAVDD
ncbi:DEAD/DEAH box helicase [Pseudonocardia spinosispora]|uniref:DEAD/DEAH box helicase n=1 Tax=Pseudonocardia spinosispora TaxID=103441 RepID=UPI00042087E4|nr:DEAD/DEAH box helicase [Pseudonocardia spinosispora]